MLWHQEMVHLKTTMASNGYVENYVERQIYRYLSTKYSKNNNTSNDPQYGPHKFKVHLKVPYLGDATRKLESTHSTGNDKQLQENTELAPL